MPNDLTRVEIITGRERRRRSSAEQKRLLVEETIQTGMTVSTVVRLHGVSSYPTVVGRHLFGMMFSNLIDACRGSAKDRGRMKIITGVERRRR